ncbi:uncharacterized protein B0I36DRAFT_339178, partial [Microdochium trichocladiopsis]
MSGLKTSDRGPADSAFTMGPAGISSLDSLRNDGQCQVVVAKISDFKKIQQWTPERYNQVHTEEAAWLRERVATLHSVDNSSRRRLLVATHHAPCVEGTSRPEHTANPWTAAFATDLLQQPGVWDGVKAWVFGHTHYSTAFLRKGIRVVANQRGYVLPGSVAARGEEAVARKRNKTKKQDSYEFDATRCISV